MKDARPLLVLEDNDEDFETLIRLMGSVPFGSCSLSDGTTTFNPVHI